MERGLSLGSHCNGLKSTISSKTFNMRTNDMTSFVSCEIHIPMHITNILGVSVVWMSS